LASLMQQQALKYGLETIITEVTKIEAIGNQFDVTAEDKFSADVLIIAAGSEYRKLGVPGENEYTGRGVSYCATCDGFLFRDRDVAVVGGGDTAITDALELSQHASKVYIVHRRDQLRAGKVLEQRAKENSKIEFIWDSIVEKMDGEPMVSSIQLRNVKTNKVSALNLTGVFVAIGFIPNSSLFTSLVKLNNTGHIITDELMVTSVPGIFAAGDIRQNSARQVSSAVGDGATAAISAFRYLKEK